MHTISLFKVSHGRISFLGGEKTAATQFKEKDTTMMAGPSQEVN